GQVRRLCQHAAQRRAQRAVSRRPRASDAVMPELPIGPLVDATPAGKPDAVTLTGRTGRVERLDPGRHGAGLWAALQQHDALWTYMSYGPSRDEAAFLAWLEQRAGLADPFYYAVVDADGSAVGITTLVEIRPAMRAVEVGHIVYSPALQRTPLATEAQY